MFSALAGRAASTPASALCRPARARRRGRSRSLGRPPDMHYIRKRAAARPGNDRSVVENQALVWLWSGSGFNLVVRVGLGYTDVLRPARRRS